MAAAFQPTGRPELPRDSPAARNMMLLTNNFRAGAARVVASTADVSFMQPDRLLHFPFTHPSQPHDDDQTTKFHSLSSRINVDSLSDHLLHSRPLSADDRAHQMMIFVTNNRRLVRLRACLPLRIECNIR